jgi:hypothetical protein
MARCKFCGKEIVWMQDGRKKIPVEVDGAKHECEAYQNAKNSYKVVDPSSIDPEILKQYQDQINKKKK